MSLENISICFPPTTHYKIRKKTPSRCSSYKKVCIAKKIIPAKGFPKPLSCEEDFVLEYTNNPQDFLKPVSGFYKYPQLDPQKLMQKSAFVRPIDIVGPIELYHKAAQNRLKQKQNEKQNIAEMLKKNRSLISFAQKSKLKEPSRNDIVIRSEETESYHEYRKIPTLHQQKVEYWNKILRNLSRKSSIKPKRFKKTLSLWQNLDSF